MNSVAAVSDFHPRPKAFLQIFWDLAAVESKVRSQASLAVLRHLNSEASEQADSSAIGPTLSYAIKRLVKGLASCRECARQGFALALTQVWTSLVIALHVLSLPSLSSLFCFGFFESGSHFISTRLIRDRHANNSREHCVFERRIESGLLVMSFA